MEKVLIIDDNPTDRFVQKRMLEHHYDVKVTEDPIHGGKVIKEWSPDIVVVDYAMPEMNGVQAIKYFKEKIGYNGIILILTGLDDVNIATEAIRRGAYDYLVKPLVQEIFNHKIKNCMNYKKLLQAENEKIANAAVEKIILTLYYDLKPIYERLHEFVKKGVSDKKMTDEGLTEMKESVDKLGSIIKKLGGLDQATKKEYVESILEYYLN